jgi:hypothetical protein
MSQVETNLRKNRGHAEVAIMIPDDRPMLSMHENGIALYLTYRDVRSGRASKFPPWQMALFAWWRFVARRETVAFDRRLSDRQTRGNSTPSPASDAPAPQTRQFR